MVACFFLHVCSFYSQQPSKEVRGQGVLGDHAIAGRRALRMVQHLSDHCRLSYNLASRNTRLETGLFTFIPLWLGKHQNQHAVCAQAHIHRFLL